MNASSTWVELPKSRFGIDYAVDRRTCGSPNKPRLPLRAINTFCIGARGKKKPPKKSPFEVMFNNLNAVASRSEYPEGTAIMYIREIFEPGDPEFGFIRSKVNLPQLGFYKAAARISTSADVLRHFDGFKRRYASTRDVKERFDLLFGFSVAIKQYSAWMHRYERVHAREKMIAALARHWRNLLGKNSAQQLSLDKEFSYQAIHYFLKTFKQQTESIETFGDPAMQFLFEAQAIYISSDDASVSTMTMSGNSRFSI